MFTSQLSHISFTIMASILLLLGGIIWLVVEDQLIIAALMSVPFIALLFVFFSLSKVKGSMDASSHAVGQFIKGDLSARIIPGNHLDPFGMLQHRVNNLLDIVDLMVRDDESLIQPDRDGDYYQKIVQAPLMKMLQQERDAIEMSRIVPILESEDDEDEEDDEEEVITVAPRAVEKAAAEVGVERFARKVDDLNLIANEIQSKLMQWQTANQSIKAGDSQQLIQSAETTRNNVEAVAAAAEELSYSIAQISQRMVDSDKVATQAVEHANKSNEIVKDLTSASEKIGTVVQMISDIAGQTNLLALNATIEAARAGEAGRGFAVVATEVKTLADQTSKATDDITRQIQGLQQSAKAAVRALEEIGKTIASMNEISSSISESVQEQNVATNEISENIQTAAANTQDVVEGVSHMNGSGVSAHSEVMQQLDDLSKQLLRELSALESNMKQEAA